MSMAEIKPQKVVSTQEGKTTQGGVHLTGLCGRFFRMAKPKRPTDIKEQVGLRLRAVREIMGLNQAAFGNLIGVSETALGNWERGEKLADVLAMLRLQMRYDWPLEWFYAGRASLRDFDLRQQLESKARELGAVIGAPIAEYPNEVPTTMDGTPTRAPGKREKAGKGAGTLHEGQAKFG